MPFLEGVDGVQKIPVPPDDHVGVDDGPDDISGKLMSISDSIIWRYFQLLSAKSSVDLEKLKQAICDG